jgi:trk system potassium uptake protein TrkA
MARNRIKHDYIVVGLDSFGENLALALQELGHSVLGIDRDRDIVQQLSDNLQDVIAMDAGDYETLASLGVDAFDTAVVAIGGDLPQAVLVTLALKDLGVRRVVSEAQSERDRRVLLRVGADAVVTPAIESARAIAYQLTGQAAPAAYLRFANQLALKWRPTHAQAVKLEELMVAYPADLQVMLVVGQHLIFHPGPETIIVPGDDLLVVGPEQAVATLMEGAPVR